jgi:hypothetical protein
MTTVDSLAQQGQWKDAVEKLNAAGSLLDQASAAEEKFRQEEEMKRQGEIKKQEDMKKQQASQPPNNLILIYAGIAVAVIVAVVALALTRMRSRKSPAGVPRMSGAASIAETKSPLTPPSPPSEVKPKPPSETKLELEHERITEMLHAFEEKYKKGEITEKSYQRLKSKYEAQLKEIEKKIAQG